MSSIHHLARRASVPLALLIATPALAQQGEAAPDLNRDSITVGVGAAVVPTYEGSDRSVITAAPGARGRVSGINFTVRGNRAWADVIPTDGGPGWDFQLGPLVNVNLNRTARIKDPQVSRLGKIKAALEAGGYVGIGKQGVLTSDYDKLTVSVAYVHDVGDIHKSYVVTPSIDYGTPLSRKIFVGINLSADYMGDGYADTYFGVSPAGSVASGLPAYRAGKGWKDWSVGGLVNVSLTGDLTHGLSAVGGVGYSQLLNDAAESPLVSIAGSRNQLFGVLGLAYTF
ncbi:MipA/OmpV family protein [Sphingomonas sp. RS6]